jgi:hypothetical protein
MGPRQRWLICQLADELKQVSLVQPAVLPPRLLSKFHSVAYAPWLEILEPRDWENNSLHYLYFGVKVNAPTVYYPDNIYSKSKKTCIYYEEYEAHTVQSRYSSGVTGSERAGVCQH